MVGYDRSIDLYDVSVWGGIKWTRKQHKQEHKDTLKVGIGKYKQGRFIIYRNDTELHRYTIIRDNSRHYLCELARVSKAKGKFDNYKITFDIIRRVMPRELRGQI